MFSLSLGLRVILPLPRDMLNQRRTSRMHRGSVFIPSSALSMFSRGSLSRNSMRRQSNTGAESMLTNRRMSTNISPTPGVLLHRGSMRMPGLPDNKFLHIPSGMGGNSQDDLYSQSPELAHPRRRSSIVPGNLDMNYSRRRSSMVPGNLDMNSQRRRSSIVPDHYNPRSLSPISGYKRNY